MRLGRYELIRRIATGGMAEIYVARERGLAGFERAVIVKRILPSLAQDRNFVDLFLDEARVAARLAHPNVVHIYELGAEGGSYYIAMEYVAGCNLQVLLSAWREPLPLGDAIFITSEMLQGLHHAHELRDERGISLGVVHRDVAPKNVFISLQGDIKVGDFGIAKARAKIFVTAPGMVLGTFNYMSPEHALGTGVDRRADIFAAGAVLYRMVTGSAPYRGDDIRLIEVVRGADYPHPRVLRPDLPDLLNRLILRSMAERPGDRFETAAQMRREVASVGRALGLEGDVSSVSRLLKERLPSLESAVGVVTRDSEVSGLGPVDATTDVRQPAFLGVGRPGSEPTSPYRTDELDSGWAGEDSKTPKAFSAGVALAGTLDLSGLPSLAIAAPDTVSTVHGRPLAGLSGPTAGENVDLFGDATEVDEPLRLDPDDPAFAIGSRVVEDGVSSTEDEDATVADGQKAEVSSEPGGIVRAPTASAVPDLYAVDPDEEDGEATTKIKGTPNFESDSGDGDERH